MMEEITDIYEKKNIFFIEEEKNKNMIVRDFATKDKGYYSSLIICSGVVGNIYKNS